MGTPIFHWGPLVFLSDATNVVFVSKQRHMEDLLERLKATNLKSWLLLYLGHTNAIVQIKNSLYYNGASIHFFLQGEEILSKYDHVALFK